MLTGGVTVDASVATGADGNELDDHQHSARMKEDSARMKEDSARMNNDHDHRLVLLDAYLKQHYQNHPHANDVNDQEHDEASIPVRDLPVVLEALPALLFSSTMNEMNESQEQQLPSAWLSEDDVAQIQAQLQAMCEQADPELMVSAQQVLQLVDDLVGCML
jgi:hypothetical protein